MRVRLRTLEAMGLLIAARLLVRFVPLARWKHLLGEAVPCDAAQPVPRVQGTPQAETTVRDCVAAIRRASVRLPGTICLPQAMGLQWMLARRRLGCTIVLGILPASRRGSTDDLHAWAVWNGRIVMGDSGGEHSSLLQFRKNL